MRRLLVLVCCLLTACSSGGGDDAVEDGSAVDTTTTTRPIAQLQAQASQITDLLIAGKHDDVVSHFNAEMHLGLTADGLKTAWEQVVATYGAYKSRGTTARSTTATSSDVVVFDTPMTFGSEASKCRISFDRDGKVAGLFILKASVP